jgi:hypothetical protein
MEAENSSLDICDGIKLVALTASLSALLAENLSLDDQNVVGNVLLGVGQNLLIVAAQTSKNQNYLQACNDKNDSEV